MNSIYLDTSVSSTSGTISTIFPGLTTAVTYGNLKISDKNKNIVPIREIYVGNTKVYGSTSNITTTLNDAYSFYILEPEITTNSNSFTFHLFTTSTNSSSRYTLSNNIYPNWNINLNLTSGVFGSTNITHNLTSLDSEYVDLITVTLTGGSGLTEDNSTYCNLINMLFINGVNLNKNLYINYKPSTSPTITNITIDMVHADSNYYYFVSNSSGTNAYTDLLTIEEALIPALSLPILLDTTMHAPRVFCDINPGGSSVNGSYGINTSTYLSIYKSDITKSEVKRENQSISFTKVWNTTTSSNQSVLGADFTISL